MRVEQLYPFPQERLREILAGYPGARAAAWVQEEPRTWGRGASSWSARPDSCRPGVALALRRPRRRRRRRRRGNANVHKRELEELLGQALG